MAYLKVEDNFEATIVGNYSTTASTITLSSVPVAVTAGWLTVYDFDGNQFEKIYFGGVSSLTITSVLRGLSFSTNSQTEVTANKKELKNGMVVRLSVSQNYLNEITDALNGTTGIPAKIKYATDLTFTDDKEIVPKKYVDDLAIAGSPKATEAVYGIAKLSSAMVDPTAPVVLNNEEVSATSAANKVVKANASGKIDKGFLEVTADKGLQFATNALECEAGTGIVLNSSGINVDVGTTASKIVQLDGSAKLPAVDGSQLTGLGTEYFLGNGKSDGTYYNYVIPVLVGDNTVIPTNGIWTAVNFILAAYGTYGVVTRTSTPSRTVLANIHDGLGSNVAFSGTKKVIITFFAKAVSVGTNGFHFGVGGMQGAYNSNDARFGFSVDTTGKLYSTTATGAAVTQNEITGVTLTNRNEYRLEWNPGTSCLFYVNGVLKFTHTTNLPSNGNTLTFGAGTNGDTNFINAISAPSISLEK